MNEETLFAVEDQFADFQSEEAIDNVETSKFLIFVIDNLKIGVNADHVVEIITNHVVTYLPMVPDFIRGIINLRGQMMPIMDLRLRLGKESKEDGLVIVLNIDGTPMGILVDAVDQMIDIPNETLHTMPECSEQRLVSGMATIPDGTGSTMLMLDCEQLLSHD